MKTNCKFLIFITLASILIMPTNLRATDGTFTLGGQGLNSGGAYMTEIVIHPGGTYDIWRYIPYIYECYEIQSTTPFDMFVLKIGNDIFTSVTVPYWVSNSVNIGFDVISLSTPEDLPLETSIGGPGDEYVTKKFTGTYEVNDDSYVFYVYWKILYNRNNPDNVVITTKIDAGNIPPSTEISLAYGFSPYVNANNIAWVVTSPDIIRNGNSLNNSDTNVTLTTPEVHSLSMFGAINPEYGFSNDIIGFYPIGGRRFDRAYMSAPIATPLVAYGHYAEDHAVQFLHNNSIGNNFNYHVTARPSFVVAYNGIPAGEMTEIQTGMLFASSIPIDLDYTWQNNTANPVTHTKNLTVPMGANVSLRLEANNFNTSVTNNIGFLVNMPVGLPITATPPAPAPTGFTTVSHTNGITYYQVNNGTLQVSGSGLVLAPVSTVTYGQWIIDHTMIPAANLSNIMPVVATLPAILTVTTEANYLSTDPATVAAGGSKTFTVKLPPGLTAHRDIVVNLSYTGTPSAFSAKPATMTIYEGDNSGTFTVTAASTAQTGNAVTITLTGTDYGAVLIGANKVVILSVEPQTYYIPVNPHLMSKIVKQ